MGTTKAWIDVPETNDWYSNYWVVNSQYTGPPVNGDTAQLFAGTVVITAADAVMGTQGTLNGINIDFEIASGGTPTLDVSNVSFAATTAIDTPQSGVLVARGAVSLAGTLNGEYLGNTLTLDIQSLTGVDTFTSTGLIEADNGATLRVIGTTNALLVNAGTILTDISGWLDIATALTSTGGGSISALQGTITLSGAVTNQGTMFVSAASGSSQFDGGTIDITGSLTNSGNIYVPDYGTISATGGVSNSGSLSISGGVLILGGGVTNSGVISVQAGSLATTGPVTNDATLLLAGGAVSLAGSLINDGQITDTNGTLAIGGAVSGTGIITIAGTASIAGSVAAGQTIIFANTDSTLDLGNLAGFAGGIANFSGHDVIDVNGVVTSTSYDAISGMLAAYDGGTLIGSFRLAAGATLNALSDGHGGTLLTEEQIGTPTQVERYITPNNADTVTHGAMPTTHFWSPAIVYYSFDIASNWTLAEQGAFKEAMALYQDVAGVTFEAAGGAHAATLDFVRGSNGQSTTTYSYVGSGSSAVATSATISIDTSVPGWQDLSAFGTADTSGYGGYGFTTLLHELGHAIGFGHSGPYNDSGSALSSYLPAQIFFTDTRQYSVMSYIDAAQSGADYIYNGTTIYAQTPMLYDIGAAQMIYGANTGTLSGNDTFGFNSTFGIGSAHPLSVYDFTQNTVPVVTLWDGGGNNTLDLSGFSAPSTVDLVAGTFSSVDTLVNNLAIAANTTIGGAGNDIFMVNAGNDIIDGGGGSNTVVFSSIRADYSISGNTVTDTQTNAVDTLTHIQTLQFANQSLQAGQSRQLACFVHGTRILTTRGEVPVQALRAGEDRVLTRDGRIAPIAWIGRRGFMPSRHPRPDDALPVRVGAGAIAPREPTRDLWLSPDHALAIDGVLVPVRYLLNGTTIAQQAWQGRLTYYHVELDRHDVLLAEGLPAESFLDTGNRGAFSNGAPAIDMHPDFALRVWTTRACAPLVISGPTLAAIRARLHARAVALGHAITSDPDLRVLADDRPLPPADGGFLLPLGTSRVRLRSRIWVPLHMGAATADPRRLGVAVTGVVLDGRAVALDDARLHAGWHGPEPGLRWTTGCADIATAGARIFSFHVAPLGSYWIDPAERRVACG